MDFFSYTTMRDWARRCAQYRRPHMTLVWTGRGRAMPRIVPRRGSVVHREVVEKVPMGWEG
jgi:DNA-binding protein H-NS